MTPLQSSLEEAREEGMEEGIEKGIQKGIEKGIERGMEKGYLEGLKKVALRMLKKGEALGTIKEWTGLAEREIKKLKT